MSARSRSVGSPTWNMREVKRLMKNRQGQARLKDCARRAVRQQARQRRMPTPLQGHNVHNSNIPARPAFPRPNYTGCQSHELLAHRCRPAPGATRR